MSSLDLAILVTLFVTMVTGSLFGFAYGLSVMKKKLTEAKAVANILADELSLACNRCPHSTDDGCMARNKLKVENGGCKYQVMMWANKEVRRVMR